MVRFTSLTGNLFLLVETIGKEAVLMWILSLLVLVVIWRFGANFARYYECKKLESNYCDYLNNADFNERLQLVESRVRLRELADMADARGRSITLVGLNWQMTRDLIQTFPVHDTYGPEQTFCLLREIGGVFKRRTIESINPFFWLGLIVFFPVHGLQFIGISENNLAAKLLKLILQCLYWLAIGAFLVYDHETKIVIRRVLEWITLNYLKE
jgi:hypothetical protein